MSRCALPAVTYPHVLLCINSLADSLHFRSILSHSNRWLMHHFTLSSLVRPVISKLVKNRPSKELWKARTPWPDLLCVLYLQLQAMFRCSGRATFSNYGFGALTGLKFDTFWNCFLPIQFNLPAQSCSNTPAFCKLLILTTFVVLSCAAICKLANNSHCQDWATRWRHLPWGPFGTFRWATTVCSGRRSSWSALNGFGSELISADFKALIDAKLFIFVYSKICLFPSPSWILGIATFKLWHWLI